MRQLPLPVLIFAIEGRLSMLYSMALTFAFTVEHFLIMHLAQKMRRLGSHDPRRRVALVKLRELSDLQQAQLCEPRFPEVLYHYEIGNFRSSSAK